MRGIRFAFIVIILAALFHFVPFLNRPEAAVVSGILKISGLLRTGALATAGFFAHFGEMSDLENENAQLHDQVALLDEQIALLKGNGFENESLRGLLEFKKREDISLISADIIGTDPDASIRALVINRGRESNIRRGDAVIFGNGTLIGLVEKAADGRSTVLLSTDPRSAIAVMVADKPEANGVVQGERGLVLSMTLIPQHATPEKGDLVVTTGRERFIPRGLVLGTIESVTRVPGDPFMSATLAPAVDPLALTAVAVVHRIE